MSRAKITARPIGHAERSTWAELVAAHGTVFQSLGWLDLLGNRTRAIGLFDAGGHLRGGFSFREETRMGFRIARNPAFTPSIGPFFESRAANPASKNAEQREALTAMAEYFEGHRFAILLLGLRPSFNDPIPFFLRGWKVVPHITYRLNLERTSHDLLAGFSSERRKSLRKAEKLGIEVEDTVDNSALLGLIAQTYERQSRAWPRDATASILERFNSSSSGYSFGAMAQGKLRAGGFFFHDDTTAYYLMGGYADDAGHAAGPSVMWHAIQKAKSLGLETFDFEGSMIPDIERYFRGFGGTLTPYFTVNRAWFPIEVLLKARFRNRF